VPLSLLNLSLRGKEHTTVCGITLMNDQHGKL